MKVKWAEFEFTDDSARVTSSSLLKLISNTYYLTVYRYILEANCIMLFLVSLNNNKITGKGLRC
jgi:hypothetical protein